MTAPCTGSGERVTPVTSLGQRVRTEAQPNTVLDDLVDGRHVVPRIEVVDQLAALVADEAAVLELRVMLHLDSKLPAGTLRAPTNH